MQVWTATETAMAMAWAQVARWGARAGMGVIAGTSARGFAASGSASAPAFAPASALGGARVRAAGPLARGGGAGQSWDARGRGLWGVWGPPRAGMGMGVAVGRVGAPSWLLPTRRGFASWRDGLTPGSALRGVGRGVSVAVRAVGRVLNPGNLEAATGISMARVVNANSRVLVPLGVVLATVLAWRVMWYVAGGFVSASEALAEAGFFALALACTILAGLYVRSRFQISENQVHRAALRRLRADTGLRYILGEPLNTTELRATVQSGGGLKISRSRGAVRFASKRLHMMFPIKGSRAEGLVSIEVKKRGARASKVKLLAVDVPSLGSRFFLEGSEEIYAADAVMRELRDPVLKSLSKRTEEEHEAEDEAEFVEEEEAEERGAEAVVDKHWRHDDLREPNAAVRALAFATGAQVPPDTYSLSAWALKSARRAARPLVHRFRRAVRFEE